MQDETRLVVAGRHPEKNEGVVNPPVYHASTILYPTVAAMEEMAKARLSGERRTYYGRSGTSTTRAFEDIVTELEGGYRTALLPSGLAAISIALLGVLKQGDHLLMVDSVYGPSRRFCDNMLPRMGVETTYYDPAIGAGITELMRDNTAAVFTEAPGSLTFEMQDIPAIAAAAKARGAVVLMDNTWATPYFFKPLDHGVDISIQAGTKYYSGHSDIMLGTVTTTEEHWPAIQSAFDLLGQAVGPDDVYLAQRGIRTLAVRLRQHFQSGLDIARWLAARPEVEAVMHPALEGSAGHDLWQRDFKGASGLFSIRLKPCPKAALAAFLDDLELFGMGYSWGGYESLAVPARLAGLRTATEWPHEGPLVRLHIGLESVEDLKDDLAAGFDRLNKAL
ncbi:cystathionine beta-lyase [Oceanibacterium hippocampi]|uniref:Cystathionine beta-lyase MetC n=1 Tax=Oceanibacterium hippocampi TaxID=745714 RepID=A0A1Y5SWU1_9PROT|nr:cystathionine beta-lyase [Oceanibacterium hippocampi]SLN49879.1 Cystathionine beta-lyase MetC [Oceanibacterium hippocampi]